MGLRIPVDTGGSFTNVSVADDHGVLHVAKSLTDVEHVSRSMEEGLVQLAPGLGLTVQEPLARTDVFTYGTTRATNATVEGRTARTASFTTEGFPDVLLLREDGKLEPFPHLDEASLVAAIEGTRELGEEAVAVCLDDSLVVDDQQRPLLRSR